MSTTAGGGLQPVFFERGGLILVTAPPRTSVAPVAQFRLPAGAWWKINTVQCLLDSTASLFAVTYSVSAVYNAQLLWFMTGLNQLAPGAFAGNVLFGRGIAPQENVAQGMVAGQLPDVWLPPETVVNLGFSGVAGNQILTEAFLLAQSTYNEPS